MQTRVLGTTPNSYFEKLSLQHPPSVDIVLTKMTGHSDGAGGICLPPSPIQALRLFRLRCPQNCALRSQPQTPKTPRRRVGCFAAKSALNLFSSSGPEQRSPSGPSCSYQARESSFSLFSQGYKRRGHTAHVFKGGEGDVTSETESLTNEMMRERSQAANDELLLFFFQQDLNTRLQKALNQDQYEPAQQLREKISEVENEIARQREAKMGASSKEEAQDKGLALLRIKAEMQKAVEEERYSDAAALRDSIAQVESDKLAASLEALAATNVAYAFRLGQKVCHKTFGYRGIVAGMDSVCCETEDWVEEAGIAQLSRGRNQPFYQVLMDNFGPAKFMVAYVAEELLIAPEEPDMDSFSHPYVYLLFLGMDGKGDFIPSKQLREKYNASRHELPFEDDEPGATESDQ